VPLAGSGGGGGGTVQPPVPGGGATTGAEVVYWHHNDHLGTPQALTDAAGRVVWTMSQTPFGIATVNEDPDGDGIKVTNNFRFPGQYFDVETGLNYNYQRTYDPLTGRYTQSDPIGLNGGMNSFGYVGANPLVSYDPYGLEMIASVGLSAVAGGNPFIGMLGPFLSASLSVGIVFDDQGYPIQVFLQGQGQGSMGVGVFAGAGVQLGGGHTAGPLPQGISTTTSIQAQANLGAGPSAGGAIELGAGSQGGSKGTKYGVGYGGMVAAGGSYNITGVIALPKVQDILNFFSQHKKEPQPCN